MGEREPRARQTLAEHIQEEFGANLKEQIRALQESGEASTVETLMQKLETSLIEAGTELTPQRKQELRQILLEHGREIGLTNEE